MAKLTQLLGNRELAWEDNLEKGRIWAYTDGNMYAAFCNGFCWRAPGTGCAIIEVWGAAGSGAQMCCCGAGLPGNAPAYTKKCLCVVSGNYVCGYIGRSCNNSSALCFRGCSEASCVCWFGCSHHPLYEGGFIPGEESSWRGNNPWGWGSNNGQPISGSNATIMCNQHADGGMTCGNAGGGGNCCCNLSQCCLPGRLGGNFDRGCICAQGGRGGISYCMDDKSPYSCFRTSGWCGTPISSQHNMCDTARSSCGMICNWHPNDWSGNAGFMACSYGGDLNCCGGFSCTSFQGCLQTCPCQYQYHVPVAAGRFNEEGGVFTYTAENDSPQTNWSGSALAAQMNALKTMARWPSHQEYFTCWNNQRSCGCYEMQGCMNYMPTGVPGNAAHPCPGVRDHAGRGGMGGVRIKFIPAEGGTSY